MLNLVVFLIIMLSVLSFLYQVPGEGYFKYILAPLFLHVMAFKIAIKLMLLIHKNNYKTFISDEFTELSASAIKWLIVNLGITIIVFSAIAYNESDQDSIMGIIGKAFVTVPFLITLVSVIKVKKIISK